MRPRVLFVGRTRFRFPLDETLQRRYEALSDALEWRQTGTGRGRDERFALARELPLADAFVFYLALPFRVARELRRFRPDAVVAQGGPETAAALLARLLARVPAKVIFDVHGDWRAPTRLYGSRLRGLLNPLSDALTGIALRRADGIRTVTAYTTALVRERGREPDAVFPAYMDLRPFTASPPAPLPDVPTALFVGVLERYKAVDVLAAAWKDVARLVPDARLHVVGVGTLAPPRGPGVDWTPALPADGVAAALDAATVLVLPSRSEGMGRVIVEAFCRGRGVVGTRVGGIPDLVEDGSTGVLVEPGDADALAAALVRVLGDRELAARLGSAAHAAAQPWVASPQEFAKRMRELVERVTKLRT